MPLGKKMLLAGVDSTLTVLYDPQAWHPTGYEAFIVEDGRTITRTNPITLNAQIFETFILRYRKSTSRMADKIDGRFSLSDHSFGVELEKNTLVVTALPAVAYVVLQ